MSKSNESKAAAADVYPKVESALKEKLFSLKFEEIKIKKDGIYLPPEKVIKDLQRKEQLEIGTELNTNINSALLSIAKGHKLKNMTTEQQNNFANNFAEKIAGSFFQHEYDRQNRSDKEDGTFLGNKKSMTDPCSCDLGYSTTEGSAGKVTINPADKKPEDKFGGKNSLTLLAQASAREISSPSRSFA